MIYLIIKTIILILLTITPVRLTVYGLTVAECDADPFTGAFGPMRTYPRECALTKTAAKKLNAEPGDLLFVWANDYEYSGLWVYWDKCPQPGAQVDLQVENCNWSGTGFVVNLEP